MLKTCASTQERLASVQMHLGKRVNSSVEELPEYCDLGSPSSASDFVMCDFGNTLDILVSLPNSSFFLCNQSVWYSL